jgi:Asx homology domain
MELQVDQSDDTPSLNGPYLEEPSTPSRKRQRQNIQDLSSSKAITPVRASGRIRIKMTAAAELKTAPEPAVKPVKTLNANINGKQRRRPKKLKSDIVNDLAIDVKRPSSVLVDTSIRALLTNVAFSQLSAESQKILIESLPLVDRPAPSIESQTIDLNPSSINNEFFNRACIEWRDRLSNGEFTNEHQTKLRAEQEREKSKIDPWKARNFEGIWGIKSNGHTNVGAMMEKSVLEMKEMVEQGDFEIPEGFISEVWNRESPEDTENDSKVNDMEWEQTVRKEFFDNVG